MCTNKNRLIEAILKITHNIQFQNEIRVLELSHINTFISSVVKKNNKKLGTQERVRNSRDERVIGVRVIEVLLYSYA